MTRLEEYQRKYANTALKHCLRVKKGDSLLINYDLDENREFVNIVIDEAFKIGVSDIIVDGIDLYKRRDILLNSSVEELKKKKIGSREYWDRIVKNNGKILILETYTPDCTKDVPLEKMKAIRETALSTSPLYSKGVSKYSFPWCICNVANSIWASELFPNDPNAIEKLWFNIFYMCMINLADPINEWDIFMTNNNKIKNKLNDLHISNLHYTNGLGTDLTVSYSNNSQWINMDKSSLNKDVGMVNFPSYEIFSTPDFRKTNGVVYSSKPLIYNGNILENFGFEFKDGKVVRIIGDSYTKKILSSLLSIENASYLGETALVENDSLVNKTNLVYNSTLLDENASCHLALGKGFPLTIPNGGNMEDEELLNNGINVCSTHVDFMVGTDDLNIEASTNEGKELIYKKGKFNI